MWDRIKQEASITAAGLIEFGAPISGFRGVPTASFSTDGPYGFTYVLSSADGNYEIGYYVIIGPALTNAVRNVYESSIAGGFAPSTTGLTLIVAPTTYESLAVSPNNLNTLGSPRVLGYDAIAGGGGSTAKYQSIALGVGAQASSYSTALGASTGAGNGSVAIGQGSVAADASVAINSNSSPFSARIAPQNAAPSLGLFAGSSNLSGLGEPIAIAPGGNALISSPTGPISLLSFNDEPGVTQVRGIVCTQSRDFTTQLTRVWEVTALVQKSVSDGETRLLGSVGITSIFTGASASNIVLEAVGNNLRITNNASSAVSFSAAFSCVSAAGYLRAVVEPSDELFLAPVAGSEWEYLPALSATTWGTTTANSCVATGNRIYVFGTGGRSADSTTSGNTWFYNSLRGSTTLRGALFGTRLLVGNQAGQIYHTANWLTTGLGSAIAWGWGSTLINCFASDGTTFVAAGSSGRLSTSTNGTTWTTNSSLRDSAWGTTFAVDGMAYGAGVWVVGGGQQIAISTNLVEWTLDTTTFLGQSIISIVFLNDRFFVLCASSTYFTSYDGVNWQMHTGLQAPELWGPSASVLCMATNGSTYVAGSSNGRIATSRDGIVWTATESLRSTAWGTSAAVNAIAWTGTSYIAVGGSGRAARSL